MKPTLCRARRVTEALMPGDSVSIDVNSMQLPDGSVVVVEPRIDTKTFADYQWPTPQVATIIAGEMSLINDSPDPILVYRNEHLCQVRLTTEVVPFTDSSPSTAKITPPSKMKPYSAGIILDDQLNREQQQEFANIHSEFDDVFQPVIGRYNDFNGRVRARVNIGDTKPPPKKLHAPNYGRSNMEELQDKFDELESQGVFVRPEDVGVAVEYVSPSFLVNKSDGVGKRLVTAFTSIGEYSKTLPISMPTVDDVLRTIASWKYIIKTDLRDSFYQIPLEKESMKWCGTQTPFRGLRCYAVSAQGMPGSSETLEEMMCTVIGQLVRNGQACKIADDLYVGTTHSVEDLLINWHQVLIAMRQCGLKLKSTKTYIAPTEAQILGWNWKGGTISACSHKISPLCTCKQPENTTAMRSFIGAFKVFNRVLRGCSSYLSDLETAIAGKQKSDKIIWTDSLRESFAKAQSSLKLTSCITTPIPTDQLVITHDGSRTGIGSVMFVNRSKDMLLGGFFSAKLKSHQSRWLPCEIEALSIAASIQHFAPFIRESENRTQILTDSKPCVQAYQKMIRGEFSTSARVATFLSTLAELNVELHHISGDMNLPSDYHSRNPQACSSKSCQICKFIDDADTSCVRTTTIDEILSGQADTPYANRNAWKTLQLECNDLRRVHAHLSKGTRPAEKRTNVTAVKRYLRDVVIGRDGLLVVIRSELYHPRRELIVVPQHLIKGLLTAMHLQLNHASSYQLNKVFSRSYFGHNVQKYTNDVVAHCHTCQALKSMPKESYTQSSHDFPNSPTKSFAADVIKRHSQMFFVLRDTFSSFTAATMIASENSTTLKDSLISSVSTIRSNPGANIIVRVDNAPGFRGLKGDNDFARLNITLDFGRVHNPNKNPVVDKGIQELITEILKICPEGGKVTPVTLAYAINTLNSRIRNRGLSAWEILFQRDQNTLDTLDLSDTTLASEQQGIRSRNQDYSTKCKSKDGTTASTCHAHPGDLVFLKADGDKTRARERYIIVSNTNDGFFIVQKINKSLRNIKYRVKPTEVYPVATTISDTLQHVENDEDEDDDGVGQMSNDIIELPNRPVLSPNQPTALNYDDTPNEEDQLNVANIDTADPDVSPECPQNEANDDSWARRDKAPTDDEACPESESPQDSETPPPKIRPQRKTGRPKRFADYVLY